jgi:predicted NAD/FAD-binding protein
VHASFNYDHPVFDESAIAAQKQRRWAVQVVDEFTCPAGLPVSGVIRAGLSCQSMVMAMSGLTR